ncbi:superfamily I DNA/RNA helicase [Spiroplasma syrphidicola EA-1]|uniref:Superfamily I DNA/RNA helicase n=1 Tax=Spiroplasma syrphidicola EA-1 TaxID=1276229 RepID=R4UF66_9MOLU|nr:AAA domain-containing protein [Spiroplasma syrphidicola]AGM26554.1 superfamily I DNA/RNA helicase [Spiroplasma syrphidicola EA-1]
MVNDFIINGNNYNGKALLLNFYLLTNGKNKFTDEDVQNLKLENIKTIKDLYGFFKKHICLADFFVCLINDQAKIKKDKSGKEKTLYDVLIRFKSITFLNELIDPNLSLTVLGDIDPALGIVNVKNIFLTGMEKTAQDFETPAQDVVLEVSDNFNHNEAKIRTIFGSDIMSKMKFLVSNFQDEKEEWLKYLNFQQQDLDYKRKKAAIFLGRQLVEYVKIPRSNQNYQQFHDPHFVQNNFWYVKKSLFQQQSLAIYPNFEEVTVVFLDLLVEQPEQISDLQKLANLSLTNWQLNREYSNDNLLSIFNFTFNEAFAQDNSESFELGFAVPLAKDTTVQNTQQVYQNLMAIFQSQQPLQGQVDELKAVGKILAEQLNNYYSVIVCYEFKSENDYEYDFLLKNVPEYGYLGYLGKGESTLIRRSNMIIDKIVRNDVANPYLINYLFNIKDLKLKFSNKLIQEKDLTFAAKNLNNSQKAAIVKALNSQDIFLLQGPPGTGKTEFIAELVYQYAKLNKKVLISSQNHTAIDNVLTRLFKSPLIVPLRLTGEEVRKKNRFNDFNPDRVVFNNYRFMHSYLTREYLTKWEGIDDQYQSQKEALQNLKANAKMLAKELNEYQTLETKIRGLKTSQEENLTKLLTLKNDNKKLLVEINNIDNFQELLKDSEWNGHVQNTNDLTTLFNQHFGPLIQEKLNLDFDVSYSIPEVYRQLLADSLDPETITAIADKKGQLLALKQVEPAYRDDNWATELLTLNEAIINLQKQASLKQGNVAHLQQTAGLQTGLIDLKSKYQKQISDNEKLITIAEQNQTDQELSYLETEFNGLEQKINQLKVDVENIVYNINQIFNMTLNIKDITTTINELDDIIVSLDQEIKTIQKEKIAKGKFVNNMINFLDRNYQMTQFLTGENFNNNIFTPALEKDTKIYANQFLQNNVNVVAMTATSNQIYLQSKNKILADYNISDIDIKSFSFDVVIIDEVSKLTPMEILMPLVYGKAVVLVGDYRQLPPMMQFQESDVNKINELYHENYSYFDFTQLVTQSMFKKLISQCDDSVKGILVEQFRSHGDIMKVVNVFYENQLQLGDPTHQNLQKQHYLNVGNKQQQTIFSANKAIYWLDSSRDTNQELVYEQGEAGSTSLFNWLEIELTIATLKLIDQGYGALPVKLAHKPNVAVISFYGLHVKKLRKALQAVKLKNISLEISTVDDYQGRESDIVIVNTVRHPKNQARANKEFVQKYERLNVAFSRAKNMLVIIGSINFFANIEVEIPTVMNPTITKLTRVYDEIIKIIRTFGSVWTAEDICENVKE